MGLDIVALRRIKLEPAAALDEDGEPVDWKKHHHIRASEIEWTEGNWPGRTEPIKPGIYSAGEERHFKAGSYIGYSHWRGWLAREAGHGSPEAIWDADNPSGPFVELIKFADNEGIIGSVVAAKLAKDFAEHEVRIIGTDRSSDFAAKYREWRKAFEMAADGGCVLFR